MAILDTNSLISSTLGSFQLKGKYISLEDVNIDPITNESDGTTIIPNSVQKLIKRSDKLIIIRESTLQIGYAKDIGAARTTGTMWYKGEVVGFTVEDKVRDIKTQDQTAIPDTIITTDISSIPPSSYNLVLRSTTSTWINPTSYNGKALAISSNSDPTGINIFIDDINTTDKFDDSVGERFRTVPGTGERKPIAFDGVFLHHGGSELASSGCVIFGTQRYNNGKVSSSASEIKALNKWLQEQGIVGNSPKKLNNLIILDLAKIPRDKSGILMEIIDGETGRPIPGTEVISIPTRSVTQIEIEPLNLETGFQSDAITIPSGLSKNEERRYIKQQERLRDEARTKKQIKVPNPLSIPQLTISKGQLLSSIKFLANKLS
tara:strand:- start:7747 stop:8874 length:1128 start_codon:yes stop_codon:yes gene_type:complete